jgi:hypothetical protein
MDIGKSKAGQRQATLNANKYYDPEPSTIVATVTSFVSGLKGAGTPRWSMQEKKKIVIVAKAWSRPRRLASNRLIFADDRIAPFGTRVTDVCAKTSWNEPI